MSPLKATFIAWVPLAIISTILCGLVYVAIQQDLRMSANDELVQISEDISSLLAAGTPVQEILPPSNPVDISKSLAMYVAVYSATGTPVASTAVLNGQVPVPPSGVFVSAQNKGQDRFTWQPANNVRSAVVVTPYTESGAGTSTVSGPTGYVLAGRSLNEIEAHESQAENEAGAAWILCLVLSFAAIYVSKRTM